MEKVIEKMDFDTGYTSNDGVHWVHHPSRVDILKKINEIVDVVNSIAEPTKHGRWGIISNTDYAYLGKCSICKVSYCISKPPHYCPNCGAKMDEVKE